MTDEQIIEAAIQGHASTRDAILWAMGRVREQANTHQLPSVSKQNTHKSDDGVRQPLTEAQIKFLHDMSADGDYLDFARLIEAKHGIFEIANVCPECGMLSGER